MCSEHFRRKRLPGMVMRISLWKERGHLFPLEKDLITGKSFPEKQTVTRYKEAEMALYSYVNRIRQLDLLIRQKRTGTPKELAEKLRISERWLYTLLDELRVDLECPIRYDRRRRSYVYEEPGKVMIGFTREIEALSLRKIRGGRKMEVDKLNFFKKINAGMFTVSICSVSGCSLRL